MPYLLAAGISCLAYLLPAAARIPTPEEVGIPERFRSGAGGAVVLQVGGTTSLSLGERPDYVIGSRERFRGAPLRFEPAQWGVFGPGKVVRSGTDSATIEATAPGQGYIQAHRYFDYREDNATHRGIVVKTWVMVVNETGRIEIDDRPPGITLPESTVRPDLPKAFFTGRAVLRGTDQGVADAVIQLIGERSGVSRSTATTGANGNFDFVAENLLTGDRYELFVRKASANVARADSFEEDLWPVRKYMLTIDKENHRDLNVGRIEMASVSDLWGHAGVPADRGEIDITPAPSVDAGRTAPTSPSTVPADGVGLPWPAIDSGAVKLFVTTSSDAESGEREIDLSPPARTLRVYYKGYAEVDFHLKASMGLELTGADVTGELYAPAIHGQNVRLPGARMQLQGTLSGEWEDGGTISGNVTGHILWAGAQPEAREGGFRIRKVGDQIHFQSTQFYYNRYIFGAQGVKYAGGSPASKAATANSLVILIDASGSMSGNKIDNARATARRRIAALGPETELAVIAFSGNAVKFPFAPMDDDGRARAQAAVDKISASGGTPLAAAIRDAGSYMRRNARGRRLTLLVLSDGAETGGGDPPAEVRRLNDMQVNW